jgi:glycosyltransferase involved in cell wall biosynthesis
MEKPVTISLIAPIYGVEKYIGRFADSVLGQSYPHIQFIFVNDGTKDSSMKVLNDVIERRYCHLKERIFIVDKENGGLPAARRTGMEHASGDYIWHVDPDDWIDEGAVEKIVSVLEATDCDFLYFDIVNEYAGKSKVKKEKDYTESSRDRYLKDMFNHKAFGCVWNKCVKHSVYQSGNFIYPEYAYGEDTFLTVQLAGFSKSIVHLKEVLYHYRKDNPNSITRQNIRKRHREYCLNFLALYENYKNVPDNLNPVKVLTGPIIRRYIWYSLIYGIDLIGKLFRK